MPTHKRVTVEGGKHIDIFDGYFPMSYRLLAYEFCYNSFYRIGWADTIGTESDDRDYHLYSLFSEKEFADLRFMEQIEQHQEIMEVLGGLPIKKVVVNLSTPSSIYRVHTHDEQKVMLYYINLRWEPTWYGETLFYSEDLSEVQFAHPYVPGRLLIFDASIPHTLRPQSHIATVFRFTLSVFLG